MLQLTGMGIESIGDLAFTFESADEVMAESPDLLEAWLLVARDRRTSLGTVRAIVVAERQLLVAAASLPLAIPQPGGHGRPARGRPRPTKLEDTLTADTRAMTKAAEAAIALSLT